MKKQKKQKNISFWIEMILNKQYFIHFGIKLFWLVCSFYMGKWFFNYQVEYILKSATYLVSWDFACKTTKILLLYIFLA